MSSTPIRSGHTISGAGRTRRRVLVLGLTTIAAPLSSRAQAPANIPRIGYLAIVDPAATAHLQAFRDGLQQLGYVEGKTILIDYKWSADTRERLPQLAAELVRQKVDVIVAWGTAASMVARDATRSIPIVLLSVTDPVGTGLVKSFARPGGNITGTSNFSTDLSAKVVEFIRQIAPKSTQIAGLRNPLNPSSVLQLAELEAAAKAFKMPLQMFHATAAAELDGAFAQIGTLRNAGVVVLTDPMFVTERKRIADLALQYRLPTFFVRRENATAGGLLSYGSSIADEFRLSAIYVGKILKGTKPQELPVEMPTRFELVINAKTARALGLTIPYELLLRATELIE